MANVAIIIAATLTAIAMCIIVIMLGLDLKRILKNYRYVKNQQPRNYYIKDRQQSEVEITYSLLLMMFCSFAAYFCIFYIIHV